MSVSDHTQPFIHKKYCVIMTAKMKATASQTILHDHILLILLQPVQKHLFCLTARIKLYLLEFTPYELPETSVVSESSYVLIALNQEVVDKQS